MPPHWIGTPGSNSPVTIIISNESVTSVRCLVGNASTTIFPEHVATHVPTPNLEGQESVGQTSKPLTNLGMRDCASAARPPIPSIAQWVDEVHKPSHYSQLQYLGDGNPPTIYDAGSHGPITHPLVLVYPNYSLHYLAVQFSDLYTDLRQYDISISISSDCSVTGEVNARICKARTAFANLRHLWRQYSLSLNLKGRVYQARVRVVLLYGCETWPIRAAELRRLQVFDNRCLKTIARVGWCRQIRNEAVRKRDFGCWRKQRGGQPLTWQRSMKETMKRLGAVGATRLPRWGPRDLHYMWLQTLQDMAANRCNESDSLVKQVRLTKQRWFGYVMYTGLPSTKESRALHSESSWMKSTPRTSSDVTAQAEIVLCVALPLLIIEFRNSSPTVVSAWFIGGVFVLGAVPISLWTILDHLINYTKPYLQRHIIRYFLLPCPLNLYFRILWMVPIYALDAWFALKFPPNAIYFDTLRECYEAYVIYNFLAFLLNYLRHEHPDFIYVIEQKPQVKHLIPFCCCPNWTMGRRFIDHCRHGALQYTVIRPITTAIALICDRLGVYGEGDFNFKHAFVYLTIINNVSQVWALYCLILFYQCTKEELRPMSPVSKFLCVKFVVFMSFWQSILIFILAVTGVFKDVKIWEMTDVASIGIVLQNFAICIEMFFAALAHHFSFSHLPYVDQSVPNVDCCTSWWSMWDVSDMKRDLFEHVRHVGYTVRFLSPHRRHAVSSHHRYSDAFNDADGSLLCGVDSETNPLLQQYSRIRRSDTDYDHSLPADCDVRDVDSHIHPNSSADIPSTITITQPPVQCEAPLAPAVNDISKEREQHGLPPSCASHSTQPVSHEDQEPFVTL
ncbi:hypothetical protein T265_11495 [Opisthorchis viverrini]|uniref:Transmembrane protein 184C n=1 Tax=Opisthorchis viverrini TaxID=6198 RepID=A0A074ZXB0_OPIVI|nr:hypothetical protein T265_11495 [Opisthorchis viverrini]KER19829.1 hypothetical protein T265_11495 [Opisthorchis viverrini]